MNNIEKDFRKFATSNKVGGHYLSGLEFDDYAKYMTKMSFHSPTIIENTPLFLDAVHNINCNQFDKIRKIAFWSIKKRHFFLLDIIGKLKQFVLKLGVFKY